MGRLVAYDQGDARAIWLMIDGKLEELTPLSDDHMAAAETAQALGQRFYLKRREGGWAAFDANDTVGKAGRVLPTRDAAIMYAVHRGRR
jgi:hypothetical protein